ncbi:hypothetical protein [Streptomyces sp. NPDC018693]|uniref:hypothetical protein n=1 Tax=unclassified Streptomyces TaxID=2593676 RepID=UPI00378EB093
MTDPITLNRDQLAALLAHHADVLATHFRTDASTGLPGYRDGLNRGAELLGLHADRLTAEEEPPAVAELLDSMLTCPVEQLVPVDRDALRQLIAKALAATELKPPFPHCLVMADAVLRMLPEPTNQTDGPTALLEAADFYERVLNQSLDPDSDPRYCTAVRDVVMGLRRRADEAQPTSETHSCRNCEGVDPDTCLMNPHRPPEQCPNSEFDGYGPQCQKPAGHNLCTFEEQPAVGARQDGTQP